MQIRGEKKNIMPKTMGTQKGRLVHAFFSRFAKLGRNSNPFSFLKNNPFLIFQFCKTLFFIPQA
jgi:hypothetical protein